MTPLQIRRFRLSRPSAMDADWLRDRLDHESRKLGSRVSSISGGRLMAQPDSLNANQLDFALFDLQFTQWQ